MIIHHQNNITAFAGNHTIYWLHQPLLYQRISKTTAAGADVLIAQSRATFRFLFTRIHGRVN